MSWSNIRSIYRRAAFADRNQFIHLKAHWIASRKRIIDCHPAYVAWPALGFKPGSDLTTSMTVCISAFRGHWRTFSFCYGAYSMSIRKDRRGIAGKSRLLEREAFRAKGNIPKRPPSAHKKGSRFRNSLNLTDSKITRLIVQYRAKIYQMAFGKDDRHCSGMSGYISTNARSRM